MLAIEFEMGIYGKKHCRFVFNNFLEFEHVYRMLQVMQSKKCAKIHAAGTIVSSNGEINEIDMNDENAKLKYYKDYIDFLMIAQRQTEE